MKLSTVITKFSSFDEAKERLGNLLDKLEALQDKELELSFSLENVKLQEKFFYAEAYQELKSTGEKLTEKAVEYSITLNPKYQEILEDELRLENEIKKVRSEALLIKEAISALKIFIRAQFVPQE
jgi:ArsR family metal-binding transcriptional regulator